METLDNKGMVYAGLLLMVLIWGSNFIVAKFALTYFHPMTIATVRVLFSSMAFFILGVFSLGLLGFRNKKSEKIPISDHLRILLLAVFGVILNQILFITGLRNTTPAHAALMITTIPIFVFMLAGRFLKEGLLNIKGVGIIVSFAGVMILTKIWDVNLHSSYLIGDFLTILTSFVFALYTVLGKPIVNRYSPLRITSYVYFYGALMMIPFYPFYLRGIHYTEIPLSGYMAMGYVVFLTTFLAYIIYYWALSRIDASKVAAMLYMQPLIAMTLSSLLGFEAFSINLLIGGALIIGGVILTESV
ncbi:MAG: DMT family transporter [Acidobacteriota bacterium]